MGGGVWAVERVGGHHPIVWGDYSNTDKIYMGKTAKCSHQVTFCFEVPIKKKLFQEQLPYSKKLVFKISSFKICHHVRSVLKCSHHFIFVLKYLTETRILVIILQIQSPDFLYLLYTVIKTCLALKYSHHNLVCVQVQSPI